MFIHIGNSKNIRECDIIGIFDTDTATRSSETTKQYLREAEKNGWIESACSDIPKSFILYRHRTDGKPDGFRICFSELSTSALMQRLKLNVL